MEGLTYANSVDSDEVAHCEPPHLNQNWPQDYKTIFMLNSTEHEIFPAHKCSNANSSWHINIHEHEK